MARVYLETSFFSACVSDRRDARSEYSRMRSRQWWVHQGSEYDLFLSAEVLRELSAPGFRHGDQALALARDVALLTISDAVRGLVRTLVQDKVMPGPDSSGDAIHVAAAVVHGMSFLLTWNQRHLANPNKLPHLRTVCMKFGLVVPELVTPDELWHLVNEE